MLPVAAELGTIIVPKSTNAADILFQMAEGDMSEENLRRIHMYKKLTSFKVASIEVDVEEV